MNATPTTVRLNGETVQITGDRLGDLLATLGIEPNQRGVAVALNGAVVPRDRWTSAPVAAGDELEVIGATQGG